MIDPEGYIGSAMDLSKGEFCGEDGHWTSKFIPQKYLFANIDLTEVCKRHDWEYSIGETDKEKVEADIHFLCNLLIIMLKFESKKMLFLCDLLMQRLEMAYTTKATNEAWESFWKSLKQEVSDSKVNWFGKWMRFNWAKRYYYSVEKFGYNAYWSGKKLKSEE